MEHLFSISGFQYDPLQAKVEFVQALFEKNPVEHVIDVCVSNIFHTNFNNSINLLKQNVDCTQIEPFYCKYDENFLMEKFSQQNMNASVKGIIRLRIAYHAKNILNISNMTFLLDQMEHSPDRIKFRVIAYLEDITKLTFVFELKKQAKNETILYCDFRSELQTVCCCC
jgi:hypothetical protein